MGSVLALLVATGSAPTDWLLGAAASIVFVAAIALPAAALNRRDHKRRQKERSTAG
jgi:ABC-type spermidine/putrescine transport system permease subunit I